MQSENQIVKMVYDAKADLQKADNLIRTYIPFIRSEVSKCISRLCTEQDDEFSIAMMAFHEAIMGYEKKRGAFLNYAALLIRSRIVDFQRKEARHQNHVSIYEESGTEGRLIIDEITDEHDNFEETASRDATKQEIEELALVMAEFGISFSDVADNCPRQERTIKACSAAISFAAEKQELLDELLRT